MGQPGGSHALQVWWRGDVDQESFSLRCKNEEQLKQNLGAVGWNLTAEQVGKLDTASHTPLAYPYFHQASFERNPPPVTLK